ncbi:hypothetical protein SOASR030_36080 [Leminorella grimontii]|uniref:Biopolymer transporter ExbD n=1 Tax=Leminorella grimontii TaxID=82981 RepID=A0AAV5N9F3_9GAMM|nr:hypothetical protein [Leminorella grimontii]KFC93131.1 hypothetical protein GLGR_3522 [Leminorella grimontii ATCC 33999 = DSM 5078]GKX57496.1 hypothetical protein SOASR030_36080 [Leminorella grimontii]GKX61239.1 hypothetical protein SOASR031_35540 [Leminorella grimontii]VFS62133.1 Uncharacterised protein [Leminorella grimontii]
MKSNGHFWPAYVDMMTVLLLVYLLISMIFQVLLIVAQQNVGVKLSQQRQVEIRAVGQDPLANELRLALDTNQNYLGTKNQQELVKWLEAHRDGISKNGAVIYAAVQNDTQVGVNLTVQYDRSLEVLRIMQQHDIPTARVTINNSSVNVAKDEFVAIYVKNPSISAGKVDNSVGNEDLNDAQIPSHSVNSAPAAAGGQ